MVGFTVGGVRVAFDFSFFAAVGIFLAFDTSGYGIFCLSACLCHESGHLLLMLLGGKKPDELIFSGGGICIKQQGNASLPVLAAGSGVNFVLFVVFCFLLPRDSIYKLLFGFSNFCVGAMNLLPIGELDGKKLLERLFIAILPYRAAQNAMSIAEAVGYIAAAAVIVLLFFSGTLNFTALAVIIYITVVDIMLKMR